MMSTKNIIKYGLLWGLLIWAMVVRGQQVEILHEGEDPVWLSEQHQFVWDKVIPLHFEAGRAVYEVHHAPKCFVWPRRQDIRHGFLSGIKIVSR